MVTMGLLAVAAHSRCSTSELLSMKMSLRYWNSVGERARLDRYIFISQLLLLEELQNDSSSDSLMDLSRSLDGLSNFGDEESFVEYDDDDTIITMDSLASDMLSDDDDEDVDMVGMAVEATVKHAQFIYTPIVDESINFDAARPIRIADLDESKCILDFRFRQAELQEIADSLWPKMSLVLDGDHNGISCENKYTCPYETGLLLVLFRLSRPRRIRPDTESYFCMRKSKISAIISTFINALYDVALPYLSDPSIFQHRFELYVRLIHEKCHLRGVGAWGFIDGTLRKTCRPSRFQRLVYSGHKRCHGIKFQSVTTPDGLIALLFGPINGGDACCHVQYSLPDVFLQVPSSSDRVQDDASCSLPS
jgi:hypothetical protein